MNMVKGKRQGCAIEVTPTMVDAGAKILAEFLPDDHASVHTLGVKTAAVEIFQAMTEAAGERPFYLKNGEKENE